MKMPQRGSIIHVEGYGSGVYAGGVNLDDPENGEVWMKFEGHPKLREGYGRGIISIPYKEFDEHRVYPEQVADGEPLVTDTSKADKILEERL